MKLKDIFPKEVEALKNAKTPEEIEKITGMKVIISDKITEDKTEVIFERKKK